MVCELLQRNHVHNSVLVTWQNKSCREIWPSSDGDPTQHRLLQGTTKFVERFTHEDIMRQHFAIFSRVCPGVRPWWFRGGNVVFKQLPLEWCLIRSLCYCIGYLINSIIVAVVAIIIIIIRTITNIITISRPKLLLVLWVLEHRLIRSRSFLNLQDDGMP